MGLLFEGKIIYDKTYGHAAYGCATCCGYSSAILWYDPILLYLPNPPTPDGVDGYNPCDLQYEDVSSTFYGNWQSLATSVITVDYYGTHTPQGPGSATTETSAYLESTAHYPICPNVYRAPQGGAYVAVLTCTPNSVTRGGSVTCSVSGQAGGSTFSNWQFKDSNNNTVSGSGSSSSWSGVVVTSGTVSVRVSSGSGTSTPSATVTVTNRNWHTNPASPAEVLNGTFYTMAVPPQNVGKDSGLGYSLENTGNNPFGSTFISDGGPNNGYGYYANQPTFNTLFQYEINPDLENSSSTFYQAQCGNYSANTNPNGYISGSNLLTQTKRHEYNSLVESHYAFYSSSVTGANNPGDYVEARIATPGTTQSAFDSQTSDGLQNGTTGLYSKILSDSANEPFPVNYSETNVPLGNINYAPYAACN